MKKLNKKVPIIGGAVIGVILVIYIILCFLASGKGFIKNMTINGIKVNNMSKEEVISKLENKYQKDQNQLLLNLEMNDQKYQIDMKDNVKVNIKKQVNNIQKKYNNFFTKGYHYLLNHNENISINIKDKKTLNQAIKDSKILEDSTLVPTSYKVEKTKVIFTKGKSGKAVQQKDVYDAIETALNNYRQSLIDNLMQYPMNQIKIQASVVESMGDYVFFIMLGEIPTSIEEQGEEETNAKNLISKIELFGSDPKSLYMLNQELAARVYSAPSLVL